MCVWDVGGTHTRAPITWQKCVCRRVRENGKGKSKNISPHGRRASCTVCLFAVCCVYKSISVYLTRCFHFSPSCIYLLNFRSDAIEFPMESNAGNRTIINREIHERGKCMECWHRALRSVVRTHCSASASRSYIMPHCHGRRVRRVRCGALECFECEDVWLCVEVEWSSVWKT